MAPYSLYEDITAIRISIQIKLKELKSKDIISIRHLKNIKKKVSAPKVMLKKL